MFNRILVLFVKVRMPSAPCRRYVASALTDSACRDSVKSKRRQFIIKKNEPLRMVGISHPGKSDVHGMPQKFLY